MPRLDSNSNFSREARKKVNKDRAKRVREARDDLNTPKLGPPTPPHLRPGGTGPTDAVTDGRGRGAQQRTRRRVRAKKRAKREIDRLNTKGRGLDKQEKTIQRLVEMGILGASEWESGVKRWEREEQAEREAEIGEKWARKHAEREEADSEGASGLFGSIMGNIPVVGTKVAGAGDDIAKYLDTGGGNIGNALTGAVRGGIETSADLVEGLNLPGPVGAVVSDDNPLSKLLFEGSKRVARDVGDMAVQAVPSLYQGGAAAVEAVQGDTSRGKQLLKDTIDQSVIAKVVQGDFGGAWKQAQEHPGFAAAELSGAKAVVGRGAGKGMRAVPGPTRRAASTKRAPLEIVGNVRQNRHYSGDVINKGVQKLGEAFTRHVRKRDPNQASRKQAQRELRRRMAEAGAMNEVLRREGRTVAKNVMREAEAGVRGPRVKGHRPLSVRRLADIGGKHTEILGLLAQKIIRSPEKLREDLVKYRDLLKDVADDPELKLERWERSANKALVAAINNALNDKSFMENPEAWFEAAKVYIRERNARDADLKEAGLLTEGQEAAKQLPALQVHASVEHDPRRALPTDELLESRARAGDATTFAKTIAEAERALATSRKQLHMQQGRLKATKKSRKPSRDKLGRLQREVSILEQNLGHLRDLERTARDEASELHPGKGETHWRPRWWKDDEPVSVAEGGRMLEELGAEGGAFLSHSPQRHGSRAYHQTWDRRPEREMNKRTGESVRKGLADTSWQAMTDDLVGAQGKVDAAAAWDRAIREFGIGPDQGFFAGRNAFKDAQDYAANLQDKHPGEFDDLVPVRVAPLRERADVVQAILDDIGDVGELPHDVGTIMERMVNEATQPGPGAVALVPRSALQTWREVATGAKSNAAMKVFQMLSQNFRRVVLPFSTKWLMGNTAEAAFRSAIYGHGPLDWLRGHIMLHKLEKHDPEAAAEFAARTLGGRLYGSVARQQLHRGAEQFPDGSRTQRVVAQGGKVARVPGIKHALAGIRRVQDSIFGFNEFLEDQFGKAAIGAAAKKNLSETADSFSQMVAAWGRGLDEFVKDGLTDTNTQVEIARYADEVLGRYSRHSPSERFLIQTFMPFWDWYRNALDFVLVTLPTKHPIKVGLLAGVEQALREDLEADGQVSVLSENEGGLPGFLKGTVKTKGGGRLPLQKYLPFGAFSDPLDAASGLLLPQVSNQQMALAGLNWKGLPIAREGGGEATGGDRLLVFFNGMFESQVPAASLLRRYLEKGASAYDDSTLLDIRTRPDSEKKDTGGTLRKMFDPFAAIPPGGKGSKSKTLAEAIKGATGTSEAVKAARGGTDASLLKEALKAAGY